MKKNIFTLVIMGLSAIGFAQIPQADFETWTTSNREVLSGWNSQGLHKKTVGPNSGDAVRIESSVEGDPSIVAYVDISDDLTNLKGGFAYTEKAKKIKVNMKYDIAVGDTAFVVLSFSSKTTGTPISLDFHRITGSQTTFIDKEFDVTYIINGFNPDSCVLGMVSGNFLGQGKKGSWIEVSKVEFLDAAGATMTAIPNGDFSKWENRSIETLDGWNTTSDFLQALGYETTSVRKTTDGKWGSNGMLLETIDLSGKIISGVAFTASKKGDFTPGKPAFKADKKYQSFRADYKYKPIAGDTATLMAVLYFQGNIIASAQKKLSATISSYDEFSVDFTYDAPLTPDSAEVIFTSSDIDNPIGAGSKLYLDNVYFSEFLTSIKDLKLVDFKMYPNPAQKEITLEFTNNDVYQVKIMDMTGRITLHEANGKKSLTLNTAELKAGIYLVEIVSANFKGTQKLIIE